MSLILSISNSSHDASASLHDDYRILAAVQLERLTRVKGDGRCIPWQAIDEVLEIANFTRSDVDVLCMTRGHIPVRFFRSASKLRALKKSFLSEFAIGLERTKTVSIQQELKRAGTSNAEPYFRSKEFLSKFGFTEDTQIHFFNHHLGHILPTLFHNPDWHNGLFYTADGGGDWVTQSHRVFREGKLFTVYGGDEEVNTPSIVDSVALAYGAATMALGWKINRHEGKLTGLAAIGEPILFPELNEKFMVDDMGRVSSSFTTNLELKKFIDDITRDVRREDVAASVQLLAESVTLQSLSRLLENYPCDNLGLSGGLFANVLLNQKLLDKLPVNNIFINPVMGDAGLCTGGALSWLMERDGVTHWLTRRATLDDVYLGRDYTAAIDEAFADDPKICKCSDDPVPGAVAQIIAGCAVSIYTGRQEFGPRALGARSVLASPADASINQSLNARMERSEFMPFAPYVLEEDARDIFELPPGALYAARFMTITCQVKPEWIEKIPAVVHVDNSARPQIIRRETNPLYYDILARFKQQTGLPVLINTSFNVHEEPIINTPNECIRALLDDRVDFVVTQNGLYGKKLMRLGELLG